jgi:hypothetical protein
LLPFCGPPGGGPIWKFKPSWLKAACTLCMKSAPLLALLPLVLLLLLPGWPLPLPLRVLPTA